MQRSRLQEQREALTRQFDQEARACTSRFVVTACEDGVRQRRRQSLAGLRDQELRLDEAERRERAAQRRRVIASKQAEAASRPAALEIELPMRPAVRPVIPPVTGASASAPGRPTRIREEPDTKEALAAERARQAQLRHQDAQAAQQRIKRRLEQRKESGGGAAPLPVPSAASAAGR